MIVTKKTTRSGSTSNASISKSKSSSSERLRKQRAKVQPTLAGSPQELVIALLPNLNYSEIKHLCKTHTNFRDMCKKPIVKKMISDIEKRDSMTNDELRGAVKNYLAGGEKKRPS